MEMNVSQVKEEIDKWVCEIEVAMQKQGDIEEENEVEKEIKGDAELSPGEVGEARGKDMEF